MGWLNFRRQSNLSFATCAVLVITVSLLSFLFLSKTILNFLLDEVKQGADVSVYFKDGVKDEEILSLKQEIAGLAGVEGTDFISKEQALADFMEKHREDKELMDSLAELGYNPFPSSLKIKASQTEVYERMVNFLEQERFSEMIDKVDFHKRKPVIDKIFRFAKFVNTTGIGLTIVFVLVSFFLAFNTIKLAIYNQKEEIKVMRLVGASNNFIRGPFLVQGSICGLLSFVLSLLIVCSFSYLLTPRISVIFPEFRIFDFFKQNLWLVLFIQLSSSLVLAIFPSLIAMRKYLEV
jgi:cell division transport system permease protein